MSKNPNRMTISEMRAALHMYRAEEAAVIGQFIVLCEEAGLVGTGKKAAEQGDFGTMVALMSNDLARLIAGLRRALAIANSTIAVRDELITELLVELASSLNENDDLNKANAALLAGNIELQLRLDLKQAQIDESDAWSTYHDAQSDVADAQREAEDAQLGYSELSCDEANERLAAARREETRAQEDAKNATAIVRVHRGRLAKFYEANSQQ